MFIPQGTPIQPINVIVREAPGMAPWKVAIIAAIVGALLSLIVQLVIEYAKPYITRFLGARRMTRVLGQELVSNMEQVDAAARVLGDAENKTEEQKRLALACLAGLTIRFDMSRFKQMSTNIDTLYDIDDDKNLTSFYKMAAEEFLVEPNYSANIEHEFEVKMVTSQSMMEAAKRFTDRHGIKYEGRDSPIEHFYRQAKKVKNMS